MKKIRTIIVEDDPGSLEDLQEKLKDHCQRVEVIETAGSVKAAIDNIREKNPDLLFLDMQLPDGNGFDILAPFDPISFKIVICSITDAFALRSYDFHAVNYLLKPVSVSKLVETLQRVDEINVNKDYNEKVRSATFQVNNRNKVVIHDSGNGITKVCDPADVILITGEGGYATIFFKNGQKILLSKSLGECMPYFLAFGCFFKSSKRHIINFDHIKQYSKKDAQICLSDGHIADLGDNYRKEFLTLFRSL